jgi:hypothetical protein
MQIGINTTNIWAKEQHKQRRYVNTTWEPFCTWNNITQWNIHFTNIYTYISLTLYPRRGSRGISDIPPRRLRFTNLAMRNTADVTGGKSIAVWSQSISGVSAVNHSRLLRHPWKKERCYSFILSRTPHVTIKIHNYNIWLTTCHICSTALALKIHFGKPWVRPMRQRNIWDVSDNFSGMKCELYVHKIT